VGSNPTICSNNKERYIMSSEKFEDEQYFTKSNLRKAYKVLWDHFEHNDFDVELLFSVAHALEAERNRAFNDGYKQGMEHDRKTTPVDGSILPQIDKLGSSDWYKNMGSF
jgi:hypothetical protein